MGIGPSTKETSKHHFEDPLIKIFGNDPDLDVVGVIVTGTPDSNREKEKVAGLCATWVEAMRADACVLACDGWGNSHVDFATTINRIKDRHIPVVALTFVGKNKSFVIEHKADIIIDTNKCESGFESEVVGENTINEFDAKKALASTKLLLRRNQK